MNATGARFIVDVNHLKSKGSACDAPDAGDGQGNCNAVRVNAANAADRTGWRSNPTGTGDPDILLVGDYNSYAMEDPITVDPERRLHEPGLVSSSGRTRTRTSSTASGATSTTRSARRRIVPQVAGVGDFHINADEPSVLDYNTDFKTPNLIATLYAPDQFRVSDHDPVVIGLNPNAAPTRRRGRPVHASARAASVDVSRDRQRPERRHADLRVGSRRQRLVRDGRARPRRSRRAALDGPTSRTVKVQVTDGGGLSAVSSATVNVIERRAVRDVQRARRPCSPASRSRSRSPGASDPSTADTSAGFTYAFDCGSGYGAFGPSNTATCSTSTTGTRTVHAKIRDKDGDAHEYTAPRST